MRSKVLTLIVLFTLVGVSASPNRNSMAQSLATQPSPLGWIEDGSSDGIPDQPTTQDWYHLPSTAFETPQESLRAKAIVQVAAGLSHTCALTSEGRVKCWGDNWEGKLGNGSVINSNTPVDVYDLSSGVVSISGTHKHTCALTTAGGVKCWGRNWHGELGDGTTEYKVTPVTPQGLDSGVAAIATGGFHTCALMVDGTIRCWGANWHGQVGDGTNVERDIPVGVLGLSEKAIAIATGKYHTCAILESGALRCWGYNKSGQLGEGPEDDEWLPVKVSGLSANVAAISLGENHSCALLQNNQVMCWGNNEQGQVGIGNTETQFIPIFVPGMASNAKAIITGQRYSCAFAITGGIYCWGENWAGQLGDGTQANRLIPVAVSGLDSNATHLSAGDSHTCAVIETGGVKCWGSNSYGQLGDGQSAVRSLPTNVYGLTSGFTIVVSGGYHSCALTETGAVFCWGSNQYGQLGDGTITSRLTPVQVYGLNQGVTAIAAGSYHTCAMTASQVLCWGNNSYGQLGNGNRYDSTIPVMVSGIKHPPIRITTGANHSCVIQENGVLKCWGYNRNGQLGIGTRDDATIATAIVDVTGIDFIELCAGDRHTCAITHLGEVLCWGLNEMGQLGDGTVDLSTIPVQVVGLDQKASQIALGDNHSCAIVEDRSLRCWGSNLNGQLGDGTTNDEWHPVATAGLAGNVAGLSAGGSQTCAKLEENNAVQCWGYNQSGELGDGTTITRLSPVYVAGLNASWIGVGSQTTCAVTTEGAVQCWGTNAQGQVGDGSMPWTLTPNQVNHLVTASLEINYATGSPGSYFTLKGINFEAWSNIVIRVNTIPIETSLQTDSNGGLVFLLNANQADLGGYVVSVAAGETKNSLFHLCIDAPLRGLEDSGPIYPIPGGIALTRISYLPWGAK